MNLRGYRLTVSAWTKCTFMSLILLALLALRPRSFRSREMREWVTIWIMLGLGRSRGTFSEQWTLRPKRVLLVWWQFVVPSLRSPCAVWAGAELRKGLKGYTQTILNRVGLKVVAGNDPPPARHDTSFALLLLSTGMEWWRYLVLSHYSKEYAGTIQHCQAIWTTLSVNCAATFA